MPPVSLEQVIAALPGMEADRRARLRRNAERIAAGGETLEAEDARAILDALDTCERRLAEERAARILATPLDARVVAAFKARPASQMELKVLRALLEHPGSTSEELSAALGWDGGWHLHFGTLCQLREADLWPAPPAVVRDGAFFCGILADLGEGARFTFKPEVVKGLRKMGLRPRQPA